jgi:hypothetical protein
MTVVYRYAPSDSPDFTRGTFWTSGSKDDAEYLVRLEAGDPSARAERLYEHDVWLTASVPTEPIDKHMVAAENMPEPERLARVRDALLERADELAGAGAHPWVRVSETLPQGSRPWKGAMLYMGDEPIQALPAQV